MTWLSGLCLAGTKKPGFAVVQKKTCNGAGALQLNLRTAAIAKSRDTKGNVPMVCTSAPDVF